MRILEGKCPIYEFLKHGACFEILYLQMNRIMHTNQTLGGRTKYE